MRLHAASLYGSVAVGSFRRYSTYRAATAAGVFTNTIFGFIMAYTYLALWNARPHLGGYDSADALTYVFVGQSLFATVAVFGGGATQELAARITSGDVSVDLYRPVAVQLWYLASDLGRAAFQFLARGIPPILLGSLVFHLVWPGDALTWLAFLASALLAVVLSFGIRYLVALAGFWLLDSTGVSAGAATLGMFFSGQLLPLNIFPDGLRQVATALPWAGLQQIPCDVYLGKHQGAAALAGALAVQAAWAAALLGAGAVLTRTATRKVVLQGG